MIAPVDWPRIASTITTPRGQLELAMLAVCVGIAWIADRQAWRARASDGGHHHHLTGGFTRVVFPLTAIVLLLVARAMARPSGDTLVLDVALPLFMALAAIRIIVYVLRRLFANASWITSSERTAAFVIWGVVVLHFTGVLPEIGNELESFSIPLGNSSLSLLGMLKGALAILITLVVTVWISGFLEQRVMNTRFDINLRVVLTKLIRATLLVVGVLVALNAIGFDITLLAVFGGALGVGIGLGLQKLASNYIAGFTILLDRSIRMDDRVTVADRTGRVTRLTSRYVVIRAIDGVEAIVPNDTMVTSVVLNYSNAAPETKIVLALQVTYDSDVETALTLMSDAAEREPRVRATPFGPQAFLLGFTDHGYQLELQVWIADPEKGQDNLKSALYRSILRLFARQGIRIAQPPREFRLVNPDPDTVPADAETNPPNPPTG
jgi:small-conductance mechanosensitive channel